MLDHGNLIANSAMIAEAFGHDHASRGVSWLPLFHDMGLIGHVLQPIYVGGLSVLIAAVILATAGAMAASHLELAGDDERRPQLRPWFMRQNGPWRTNGGIGPRVSEGIVLWFGNGARGRTRTIQRPLRAQWLSAWLVFAWCFGLAEATLLVTGTRNRPENRASDRATARSCLPKATRSTDTWPRGPWILAAQRRPSGSRRG